MHLLTSFTLALSAGTALAGVVERDVKTINAVVTDTDTRLKELTTAINNFNGDPAQLLTATTNMLNSLNKGVTDIAATTPITLNDAVTLQATVTTLQNDGNALIQALNSKKSAFENAGLCEVVFKQAGDMGDVAKKLIDTVVTKVPQEVQPLAKQVSSGFTDTLKQSQQNFAPGSCTNRQGAVTPGGGAGGSSSSGPGTGNSSSPSSPVTAGAGTIAAPLALCIAAVGLLI
ncbi:hypothetical protein MAPG_09597 [Magnaporthiopsis poae ATCC 64411]|uniref:Cell wall protein n=1 Tax=Magnaporthiopsis poae (strain ATCC 64411 / 73-15) TaxID=644358 RepID=A0A0C4EAC9_MAGP6|nr:hypothetical protein MAPG_09597 [Magnaporthiopsis poae ATCC 64411]